MYRQQTLELLFQSNDYLIRKYNRKGSVFQREEPLREEETQIKTKLTRLLAELKTYMITNSLTEDNFLKNICDDIYISLKTLSTNYGAMYTSARLNSQGRQQCYAARHIPDEIQPPPMRDFAAQPAHQLSQFSDNPYATQRTISLMRSCSSNVESSEINQLADCEL
jgi:hypothetical protein